MYIDIQILREQIPEYECNVYLHDYSLCLDLMERLDGALPPIFSAHTLSGRKPCSSKENKAN